MSNRELLRAYRKEHGLTQGQLADELNKQFGRKYTTALISYTEKGFVDLPEDAIAYLASKMPEKPFRNPSVEGKAGKWVIIPHDEKKGFKSAICENVLTELKYYTKDHPFIAADYADSIGVKEVAVRTAIRELRMHHIRICSDPRHKGYWLEENGGGYEGTRKQMLSRAFKLLEVVRAMDGNQDGQLEWEEELGSTVTYGMKYES